MRHFPTEAYFVMKVWEEKYDHSNKIWEDPVVAKLKLSSWGNQWKSYILNLNDMMYVNPQLRCIHMYKSLSFFFLFQIWRSCATFRDGQSSLLTKMMGASHIELPSLEPATAIRFCDMVRNCISYYWSINAWWMPNRNKVGADFFTFCNKTKQNISILGILKISVGILKITIWSAGPTFDTLNNNNNNTLVC